MPLQRMGEYAMIGRRLLRILVFVAAAAVGAAVSNLLAKPQRKVAWVGSYPRGREFAPPATAAASAGVPKAPVAPLSPKSARPPDFPPHPDRAWVEIAFDDVKRLFDEKALFLDARRTMVYAEGHIPGARSFPVWESDIDQRVKTLYEEGLNQRVPVVVYCSGGACEDSHMLAEKLFMVGFDNVLVYRDGFPDWQKHELPVTKGSNP